MKVLTRSGNSVGFWCWYLTNYYNTVSRLKAPSIFCILKQEHNKPPRIPASSRKWHAIKFGVECSTMTKSRKWLHRYVNSEITKRFSSSTLDTSLLMLSRNNLSKKKKDELSIVVFKEKRKVQTEEAIHSIIHSSTSTIYLHTSHFYFSSILFHHPFLHLSLFIYIHPTSIFLLFFSIIHFSTCHY